MNSTRRIRFGVSVGALAASVLLLPALVKARSSDSDPGSSPPALNADDSAREELGETIEIYMLARMKRALMLTDVQEHKVVPLVEELNAVRRETNRGRRLTMMKLHPLVEDETAKDPDILTLLDHLQEIESRLRQQELSTRAELRTTLTPRQQALFIIFQERFRHEIEERLRRFQRGANAPGPGGGPMRNPPEPGRPRPRR